RRRHTRCLSDWSSDVCSSDLVARADIQFAEDIAEMELDRALLDPQQACDFLVGHLLPRQLDDIKLAAGQGGTVAGMLARKLLHEIGRASCREGGVIDVGGGAV